MDLSSKTVCVVDQGLFGELAAVLAPSFGRTIYCSTWKTAFPRSNAAAIGKGLEGVQRIESFWPLIDEIDLFVFPDILNGDYQIYLRRLGKRVWGSGQAEELELSRAHAKRWLRDSGLPVGPYRVIKGMTELKRHLQGHENLFVKISRYRGEMETFFAPNYWLIEPRLAELEHALGVEKDFAEFVVEEPIEAKAEVGYDGFTIDGQFPYQALFGVETKDAGYLGQVVPYASMPRSVGFVNQKLSPVFRELKYRGFWSSEIRVAIDGTPYLIDPCCRMASPPGELYLYLIENIAEVIWAGAVGELVEPKWRYPWGAQLVLQSGWAEHGWQPIEFPEEIRENVKLHYPRVINGRHYFVPQQVAMPEIGSVVAGGATKEEAIENVKEIAEQIKGYDVKYNVTALEDAAASMDKIRAA